MPVDWRSRIHGIRWIFFPWHEQRIWRIFPVLLALFFALSPGPAHAHKSSDAYLRLSATPDGGTELRWDIALRDLDAVLDLDADGDGRLTWGEVKSAWSAIDRLALASLSVPGCAWQLQGHALEKRSDGAYAVLRLHSACAPSAVRHIDYRLFRENDPTHRGLLRAGGDDASVTVLDPNAVNIELPAWSPSTDSMPVSAATASPAGAAHRDPSLLAEGVHHIVSGYDHVLFLLCLLLPSVMRRTPQGWEPVQHMSQAVWPVLAIVTAFTVAHSISLAIAVTGLWLPPSSIIEPAIAATIVLAALDNIVPLLGKRRVAVTFAFGLVHGFGFAGALTELELSKGAMAWALLRFNLGIELGQLAIVAVALSLLFALRRWRAYPAWVLRVGSAAAIVMGALWFAERVADVKLLPL